MLLLLHSIASTQTLCNPSFTINIPSETTVNISTLFPLTDSLMGEFIYIEEGATLKVDKSFIIKNTTFFCAEDASIFIYGTNVKLTVKNSTLSSCDPFTMWNGITVSAGTTIFFEQNTIRDAKKALYFPPGYSSYKNVLRSTSFIENAYGIWVGGTSAISGLGFSSCYGNKFESNIALNDQSVSPWAVAGIKADRTTLKFGTGGSPNKFIGMLNGIKLDNGSYAWVANCEFTNMFRLNSPEFPLRSSEGTGISLNASHITVTKPSGFNPCKFEGNVSHGIHSTRNNGPIIIEYATFSGSQRYGIYIHKATTPARIILRNNSFNLNHTRCYSAIFCSRPPGNSINTSSLIHQNQIILPPRAPSNQTGALIDIVGISGTGGTNGFEVSNNTIAVTDSNSHFKHGIYITGKGSYYYVHDNHISYKTTSIPVTSEIGNLGIVFDNMPGNNNQIYHNTIRSTLTSHDPEEEPIGENSRSLIKCAIHVNNANAPIICNNDVDSTYRGIHFSETCFNTFYGLNRMRKHVFGFHAIKNTSNGLDTDIGDQINTGNLWSPNASDFIDGGFGAEYADNTIVPFEFQFNPSSATMSLDAAPPSANPPFSSWFSGNADPDNSCNPQLSFSGGEIKIAESKYPYNTKAQNWDLQRHLWDKVLCNPGIEVGVTEVEDFITNTEETSPHLFAKALYEYEKAFYPDSIWQAQWNSILAKITAKEGRITGLIVQLSLDSLTVDPNYADSLETASAAMSLYQDTLRILVDTFAARRNNKLLTLAAGISSLPSDDVWENVWIAILDIAIRYGQGYEVDSLDSQVLYKITEICPDFIGIAAQAVIAYMPPYDADAFKNCGNGLEECEEERNSKTNVQQSKFLLFPNPTYKHLTVLLQDVGSNGRWRILSSSGILVTEGTWSSEQFSIQLNTSTYNNGFYLFQMESSSGHRTTAKFSVVK